MSNRATTNRNFSRETSRRSVGFRATLHIEHWTTTAAQPCWMFGFGDKKKLRCCARNHWDKTTSGLCAKVLKNFYEEISFFADFFFYSLCSEEKSHCCRLSNAAPSTDFHSNKHIFTTQQSGVTRVSEKEHRSNWLGWCWWSFDYDVFTFSTFRVHIPTFFPLLHSFHLCRARVFHTFGERRWN